MVPGIYLFGLHTRLLVGGKASFVFFLLTVVLLVAGIQYLLNFGVSKYSLGIFFIAATPLIHFLLFKLLFNYFVRKFGRPPRDVYMNWQSGLVWDRAFAFVVFLGLIFTSQGLIGYFHWGIALANG